MFVFVFVARFSALERLLITIVIRCEFGLIGGWECSPWPEILRIVPPAMPTTLGNTLDTSRALVDGANSRLRRKGNTIEDRDSLDENGWVVGCWVMAVADGFCRD